MKNIISQIIKFLGVSGIGWILDFCTYTLLGFVCNNLAINNVISSWVGVTFVFAFSRKKIFLDNNHISIKWKYLIYLLYQAILIFLISKLLVIVNMLILEYVAISFVQNISAIASKVIVTPITMITNFIVMKIVIEKL